MSKSRKAEKRQKQKAKKWQKLEQQLAEQHVKFDVLGLLKTQPLDTKPNMAKFLKEHVEMVRCSIVGKIQFYPTFKYEMSKVLVRFLDGHELIYDLLTDGKFAPKYYFCYQFDELKLNADDIQAVEQFFQCLMKFKFVY